jgi:hypothetical protein
MEPVKTSFNVCLDKIILDHPTKKARNRKASPVCMFIGIAKKAKKMVIET